MTTRNTRMDPQCLAGSFARPGCAANRLKSENAALKTRIRQFQFCINRVAEALGNVCCGGVDSSPEEQLADPHSTTRVLCDAIKSRLNDYPQERVDAVTQACSDAMRNAVQCPRCYKVVTESCGPNCAWRWTEAGEDELKRLRAEDDEQDGDWKSRPDGGPS